MLTQQKILFVAVLRRMRVAIHEVGSCRPQIGSRSCFRERTPFVTDRELIQMIQYPCKVIDFQLGGQISVLHEGNGSFYPWVW